MGPTVTRERVIPKGFGKRFIVNRLRSLVIKLLASGLQTWWTWKKVTGSRVPRWKDSWLVVNGLKKFHGF